MFKTSCMKKICLFYPLILLVMCIAGCKAPGKEQSEIDRRIEQKVEALLAKMTIEEKVGQMNQYSGSVDATGPSFGNKNALDEIKHGWVGSLLNISGADVVRNIQQMAVDCTRLHIPLIFGFDVIHGYKTIFPIPLAEACSWDTAAIRKTARIAATEASSTGINWTFAPMVDIARDPRWGRIMEGAGEDPFLGANIAQARVKGFQGNDLSANNTILACAKHYAAYGAAEAGRDYNTVDISERTLRSVYLPPFQAAEEAGCGSFMNSFNEIAGVPSTGNAFLLRDILEKEWGFKGFVVSDWGSVKELIPHGVASNEAEATILAVTAGCNMDMESGCYRKGLVNLVKEGKIDVKYIDDAVRRILRMKFKLGLFDDPYKYCNADLEKKTLLNPEHLKAEREMAAKSLVLLKNDRNILPLKKSGLTIALIGPLGKSQEDLIGNWCAKGEGKDVVPLYEGITEGCSNKILYAEGCKVLGGDKSGFAEALSIARRADVILMAMGEAKLMSGEDCSRSDISIPGVQKELIKEVVALNKPTILILFNGRPLTIPWEATHVPAILEAWFPGTTGGQAIADVLFGDVNPSGKLVTTFPGNAGQIPLYYNHKNTGRPYSPDDPYTTKYLDVTNDPVYPFGYGLSYTTFEYSGLTLSDSVMHMSDTLKISVNVKNTGHFDGEEIAQLYVRDMVGSVTRPVKELKGFKKVMIHKGETVKVNFMLTLKDLSFWDIHMHFAAEPGTFKVFAGSNSRDVIEKEFRLKQ